MENKETMEAIASTDMNAGGADYALRKCSFVPKDHLINLNKDDPAKPPRLYMTVEWRVYWLQIWCQENGMRYLIEERPVELIPGTTFIQSHCTVYIDGEPAGHGIGGINLNGIKGNDYAVQSCATIAKGRALANAGFGSVFSSTLDSENGADIPCDSGMGSDFFVFKPQPLGPVSGNPMSAPAIPPVQNVEAPAARPTQNAAPPASVPPTPAVVQPPVPTFEPAPIQPVTRKATSVPKTENAPKTREEALAFLVPMRGMWYNHPLSEVLEKAPQDVEFFRTCRFADLRAAAELLLNGDSENNN